MTEAKPRRRAEDGALYTTEFELRAGKDGGPVFEGYAALFDVESDAPWLPFKETIRAGAFANSLRAGSNHSFVLNHNDDILFATTRTERLRLTEDKRGLINVAQLPDTGPAHDLKALYDVGEVRGMSFSFKPTRGGVRAYEGGRELTEVKLGHTTVITSLIPGYSQTGEFVQIRALAGELSADPDDLDGLLDGLRAGRPLFPDEIDLLQRLATHFRAEETVVEEPYSGRSVDAWKAMFKTKGITFRSDEPGTQPGAVVDGQPVADDQSPEDDEPVTPQEITDNG